MTRDEFSRALEKALNVESLTDLYVRAGMLKLEEPESALERFCDAYHGQGSAKSCGSAISMALDCAGLRLVEK